jgi:hypothetical protein
VKYNIIIFLFLITGFSKISAQELSTITAKNLVKVSGGLNQSLTMYTANATDKNRQPLAYTLSANVNATVLGSFSFPFTFNYTTNKVSTSQPTFNPTSISPSYKWVKVYFGNVSSSYNQYTQSGAQFFGGGFELTPKKWRIAGNFGRFKQATPYDAKDEKSITAMSYRRYGFGGLLGYTGKGWSLESSFFSGKDDPTSLEYMPAAANLMPKENLCLSLKGKFQPIKKMSVDLFGATTLITNNAALEGNSSISKFYPLGWFMKSNSSSNIYNTYSIAATYTEKNYSLNTRLEHVDPGYLTLGGYTFNNDVQKFSVGGNIKLLKGKITLTDNIGFQRNNLNFTKKQSNLQLSNAFSASIMPFAGCNVNLGYSTFTNYTNRITDFEPFLRDVDSFSIYSISQSANSSISYALKNKEIPQSINLTFNYQQATNEQGLIIENYNTSNNYVTNLGYSRNMKKQNLNLNTSLNYNLASSKTGDNRAFGVSLGASKPFFKKKLSCNFTSSFNLAAPSTGAGSKIFSNRFSASFAPKFKKQSLITKNHSFSFNTAFVNQIQDDKTKPNKSELTSTLNYGWTF